MPPNTRALLYNALKAAGWAPDKGFTSYRLAELEEIRDQMVEHGVEVTIPDPPAPAPPPTRSAPDPEELPGQRLNEPEEVIRVDEHGRQWLQEEVRKPAYPKPRGRRVLTYVDPGVKQETVRNGEYIESFEVPGDRKNRTAEIKITLPSFQVGIYRDKRFPFRVHVYNGREGFNLHDVEKFYGGAELVPAECKRVYIENDLCYDIRSVVQAIRTEHRQMLLQKGAR